MLMGCALTTLAGYAQAKTPNTPPEGYKQCASENQRCKFSGVANVVYGAINTWTTPRSLKNGVACNNGTFGDPLPGVVKACYYKATPAPTPTPTVNVPPAGYNLCASENQPCNFNGATNVVYGAQTRWTAPQTFSSGVVCNNATFGDPLPGVVKACYFKAVSAPAPDPAPLHPPGHDMPMGIGTPLTTGFAVGSSVARVRPTTEVAQPSTETPPTGAFRTVCEPTHMANDDPIVFPGQPGRSHLHTFFGNAGVNAHSTAISIRTTGNSSCRGGTLNRSAYWVPSMVDTRTNVAVMPRGSNFYYKTGYRGVRPQDVRPFPAGLRMIAGTPMNSTPGDPYGSNAWRFHCHAAGNGHGPSIPNCAPGDDMVQEVFFPQCWDGVNLDSADHKSHMAYANGSNPGCPASHPVPLPEITFNIFYPVTNANEPTHWRLSSDMYNGPAGYSSHADWWNGWDQATMETFVRTCNNQALDCKSHLLGDGRMID